MSDQVLESNSLADKDATTKEIPLYNVVSSPSKVIRYFERVLSLNGTLIHLNLITMKRSFILVINNGSLGTRPPTFADGETAKGGDYHITREDIIRGFINSNTSLKGLSLAIGEHSTCIINSNNSLASTTLAIRLSKKLNQNRPVYVVNNFIPTSDTLDLSELMAKLYLKVFQFVSENYPNDATVDNEHQPPAANNDKVMGSK